MMIYKYWICFDNFSRFRVDFKQSEFRDGNLIQTLASPMWETQFNTQVETDYDPR